MRHAVLDGGKRMRPLLVYAAGTAFGADEAALDAPAAAVELIHAYSLVHDDLPAMDDDALRRGKPTVHVAFDEATAILAGDALQSLAFDCSPTRRPSADASRVAPAAELAPPPARAACAAARRWTSTRPDRRRDRRRRAANGMHALQDRRAAARGGAHGRDRARGVGCRRRVRALDAFADALGLAFQIRDDLLDVEGDSADARQDRRQGRRAGKGDVPGLARHRRPRAPACSNWRPTMRDALAPLGARAEALAALARAAVERLH